MAEEFTLDQIARQRRTIDLDQRLIPSATQFVKSAGNEFLAGAGLAQDQNRGIGLRDKFHLRH